MARALRKGEISMSREAIGLLKAGRNALHWSQEDLAGKAGVSSRTVKRIESKAEKIRKEALKELEIEDRGAPIRSESIEMMLSALEKAGVSFWSNGRAAGMSVTPSLQDHAFFNIAKKVSRK